MYTARFRLREDFAEGLQRRRVGMPDGDGFAFRLGAAESKIELLAYCGNVGNIVEERNIPEARAHTEALRGVISYGRRSGSAVHVKEIPFL